ncbi:hypothetical protein LVD56_000308 [Escherichia coli]|uniref:hypothetical protein n=1 Tax=Escherichia coli TaxID=562 RepID=UPI000BE86E81|nr:hypothetical protein [Escherichia coli]EFE9119534.1 hypothetical protein [Escherichia coli]EFM4192261.1 hypothetical protein [Escherichia coli]EIQ5543738.1 hypothetical protein [Escherichia coli]ELI2262847.1 hypothetical protein [Escherichia coli]
MSNGIKNNLAAYLIELEDASAALNIIIERESMNGITEERAVAAIQFLSREIYIRNKALMCFIEDDDYHRVVSDKNVYRILSEIREQRFIQNDE